MRPATRLKFESNCALIFLGTMIAAFIYVVGIDAARWIAIGMLILTCITILKRRRVDGTAAFLAIMVLIQSVVIFPEPHKEAVGMGLILFLACWPLSFIDDRC